MLKRLRYFQSVVRLNSFSAAAEENYISQSAISQQIQALERELGFPLLTRKNRSFSLTPAGAYIYQKSLLLMADYERMCSEGAKIATGGQATLRIGYLRDYMGSEFYHAVAQFADLHPNVALSVRYGNHEELYALLRTDQVDLVFNDQRRAFSDVYVNLTLTTRAIYLEIPTASPLASLSGVTPQELRNLPCILVASAAQREDEQSYYQTVLGIESELLWAENLEEAHLLVLEHKGFLLVDSAEAPRSLSGRLTHLPLLRGDTPMLRNYCAFWGRENGNPWVPVFADLLQSQFRA